MSLYTMSNHYIDMNLINLIYWTPICLDSQKCDYITVCNLMNCGSNYLLICNPFINSVERPTHLYTSLKLNPINMRGAPEFVSI